MIKPSPPHHVVNLAYEDDPFVNANVVKRTVDDLHNGLALCYFRISWEPSDHRLRIEGWRARPRAMPPVEHRWHKTMDRTPPPAPLPLHNLRSYEHMQAFEEFFRSKGPTAETSRKRRRDAIKSLHYAGDLRDEHVAAADEILEVWTGLGRALFARSQSYYRVDTSTTLQIDRMTEREAILYRRFYKPWADEMSAVAVGGERRSLLELVIDVVQDNRNLGEIERDFRMQNGRGKKLLRKALERYCEINGTLARKKGRRKKI